MKVASLSAYQNSADCSFLEENTMQLCDWWSCYNFLEGQVIVMLRAPKRGTALQIQLSVKTDRVKGQ